MMDYILFGIAIITLLAVAISALLLDGRRNKQLAEDAWKRKYGIAQEES